MLKRVSRSESKKSRSDDRQKSPPVGPLPGSSKSKKHGRHRAHHTVFAFSDEDDLDDIVDDVGIEGPSTSPLPPSTPHLPSCLLAQDDGVESAAILGGGPEDQA